VYDSDMVKNNLLTNMISPEDIVRHILISKEAFETVSECFR